MTDKQHDPDAGFFALPGQRVLALTGRDAVAFAQAQSMNDVAVLGDGQWQWNGWLTPKGRLIALFALLRLDGETLWLLLPDADPHDIAARLQRFVFRSKVAITLRDDLRVSGAFAAPADATGARIAGDTGTAIELDLGGEGGPRTLRIGVVAAEADPAASARWQAFDLRHGLPRLPAAQAEQWTPQQLSLDRLRAYSVKKGCYPGQEIVARTHFLGQAKRGLALFAATGALPDGAEVVAGDKVIGSVVCTAGPPDESLALAVLPIERGPIAPTVEGNPLQETALLDGLSR